MARKNGTGNGSQKSVQDARSDLLARAERNAEGAATVKTDPLGDAKAARSVVDAIREHTAEMARRGLPAPYCDAALDLAREIEEHLAAMPAAAVAARGRTPEMADLLADAASTAQAIRGAVLRLSRGPDGRKTARDLGFGQPFSARQPAHVARALQRILDGLEAHKELKQDLGVLPEDIQVIQDLARDLGKLPGTGTPMSDEQASLLQAQGALRAFFDLFAAKASIAMAADPDERARLLALIPRADDRRHYRRTAPEMASG